MDGGIYQDGWGNTSGWMEINLESRRDLYKSRRDSDKSRRDLYKSRRDSKNIYDHFTK